MKLSGGLLQDDGAMRQPGRKKKQCKMLLFCYPNMYELFGGDHMLRL